MAAEAIGNAMIAATISSIRERGGSDEEIVAAVLPEASAAEMAKSISVLFNLSAMGKFYGFKHRHNPAINGYVLIVQHYVDEPEAKEFQAFYDSVNTNRDIFLYFCKKTGLSPFSIENYKDYDVKWFSEWLEKKPAEDVCIFGRNQAESEKLSKEIGDYIKETK